jgi:phosphoadenosine phosphosulfate reductase
VNGGVYWCDACGVPLLQPQCENCKKSGHYVAADLKPMFEEERRLMANCIGEPVLLEYPLPFLWIRQKTIFYYGRRYLRLHANGKPEIVKRYAPKVPSNPDTLPTPEVLQEANKSSLRRLEQDATDFIIQRVQEYPEHLPVVSFSGGKDSMVVSCLVRKALGREDVLHVFGDTTIEYPDTYDYIEEFQRRHPAILFRQARAPHNWEEMCGLLEPPSITMRWCCTVFKASPLGTAIRSLNNGNGVLSFEGIRKCESNRRRKAEGIYINKKIAGQLSIRPILDWRDIHVWLYLLVHNIPINPIYKRGLTRAGCLYCPYNSSFTDFVLSETYPEQISRWRNFLVKQASESGKSDAEEYVASGGWKLRAGATNRQATDTSLKRFGKPCEGDIETRYELTKPVTPTLYEMLKPLGTLEPISNPQLGYFAVKERCTGEPLFQFQGLIGQPYLSVTLLTSKKRLFLLQRIERQIKKFQVCISCGGCVGVCPHGAISLSPAITVDEQKCIGCLECSRFTNHGCIALNSLYASQEMGRKKRMSVDFHLNFALKRATLARALQVHISTPQISWEEQMSAIGVGYKAVAGYVGWLHHTGLRDSNTRTVADLGKMIHKYDPYLVDEETKWVLHYQLCRPKEDESTLLWRYLVNQWLPAGTSFLRSQFQQGASEVLPRIGPKKLSQCANITLRCYVEEEALSSLSILQIEGKGYRRGIAPMPGPLLTAYALYDQREKHYPTATTIRIDNLLGDDGNVGKIFLLTRARLEEILHQLEFEGIVSVSHTADLDSVGFTYQGSALDLLEMYYKRR